MKLCTHLLKHMGWGARPLPCPPIIPSVWLVGFGDRVLHSQDWSQPPTPLASTSPVLGVQECATMFPITFTCGIPLSSKTQLSG